MTPQERKLIDELFDRLASLENAPRDPDAVAAINEGLQRAPNALYPLVQTVLVQDEALKRADARIRELEGELGIEPQQAGRQPGFLDNMRDALLGRSERQGSVPSVRADAAPQANKWGLARRCRRATASRSRAMVSRSPAMQPQPGYAAAQEQPSAGGSFLGTAAATAAGVVGGALLMNSFRGMFGGQQGQGKGQSAFDPGGQRRRALGSARGGGDLARQAGLDDIGRGGGGGLGSQAGDGSQRAGLFDVAQNDTSDADFDDDDVGDDGDFGGDDTA